jgi:hypothetical protein
MKMDFEDIKCDAVEEFKMMWDLMTELAGITFR